jgi:hypothetical protein
MRRRNDPNFRAPQRLKQKNVVNAGNSEYDLNAGAFQTIAQNFSSVFFKHAHTSSLI